MSSLIATQQGVIATLLTVKKINGYSYDLPDDHVYKISNENIVNSQEREHYPKIFVTLDSGTTQKNPGNIQTKRRRWIVTVYLIEDYIEDFDNPPVGWRSVSDQVRDLCEDIETAFLRNITLGDVVQDLDVPNFETDADTAYPQGIVVVYVDTFDRSRV